MSKDENEIGKNVARLLDNSLDNLRQSTVNRLQAARRAALENYQLAEAEISVFTLSTFDTDWILVPGGDADRAEEEWRRSGHEVQRAVPVDPAKRAKKK